MMKIRAHSFALMAVALIVAGCSMPPPSTLAASQRKPNILLIVADDLGYSDIGSYGGEISTPNIDKLATSGVRMSSFYSSPFCSPTRSMLLSGTDNHLAGFGGMAELMTPEQRGRPGYEGYLNNRVLPFPQLLRDAGYHTYMAGKWHLGVTEEFSPANRGFEQSYAMVHGGASHFDSTGIITFDANKAPQAMYRENGKVVEIPKTGFYSSEAFASRIIGNIEAGRGDGKPFFAYLAFTAPHWPLQAPDEFIRKYEGKYDVGYDVIRDHRVARLKELGLMAKDAGVYAGNPVWPKWSQLTAQQKAIDAKRMAVYAAMVDAMDFHIGRVVEHLKKIGEYDNTFIFFMSDNGADGNSVLDEGQTRAWSEKYTDNSLENTGRKGSFTEYGPGWAQAASPFNMYKAFVYEGGISVPAFAVFPKGMVKGGAIKGQFAHTMDVAPTLLELAGTTHPGTVYKGRDVLPIQGKSMLAWLTGSTPSVHPADHVQGWELGGRKAVRKGDWKLVYANKPWGSGAWELYDLSKDRAELNNLASSQPDKLKELLAAYETYTSENGVADIIGLAERPGFSNGREYYKDMLHGRPGQ